MAETGILTGLASQKNQHENITIWRQIFCRLTKRPLRQQQNALGHTDETWSSAIWSDSHSLTQKFQNTDLLATEPQLGPMISINTGETVNSDLDIIPTGSFTIARVRPGYADSVDGDQPPPCLYADHDPDGHTLGTTMEDRLAILHTAFCNNARSPSAKFLRSAGFSASHSPAFAKIQGG